MSSRVQFTLHDLLAECTSDVGVYRLDDGAERRLGLRVHVPPGLMGRGPYASTAYSFLQQLRGAIHEHGLIEFPGLPVNPTNHTLAQRAPWEHAYSQNPYLTGFCQSLHQDTPPYPTAFWLGAERRFFATWVTSRQGPRRLDAAQRAARAATVDALHEALVPASLNEGWGALVNHRPGLLLLDNSEACGLYHARTCLPGAGAAARALEPDAPSFAFNEVGLLEYIDTLDERRGAEHRCADDRAEVLAFLRHEARAEAQRRKPDVS